MKTPAKSCVQEGRRARAVLVGVSPVFRGYWAPGRRKRAQIELQHGHQFRPPHRAEGALNVVGKVSYETRKASGARRAAKCRC
jgi:hypothetical protein